MCVQRHDVCKQIRNAVKAVMKRCTQNFRRAEKNATKQKLNDTRAVDQTRAVDDEKRRAEALCKELWVLLPNLSDLEKVPLGVYEPRHVVEALIAGKRGTNEHDGYRVCTTQKKLFRAWHHGQAPQEFEEEVKKVSTKLAVQMQLLLWLMLALLTLAFVEVVMIRPGPRAMVEIIIMSFMVLTSLAAIYGQRRLLPDLKKDPDGKETFAQRILEFYFWASLLSILAVIIISQYLFIDFLQSGASEVANTASLFPRVFQAKAAATGVDATPNTGGVAKAWRLALAFEATKSVLELLMPIFLIPTLNDVITIVTPYEIVQRCAPISLLHMCTCWGSV